MADSKRARARTSIDKPWYERWGFWIGVALLALVIVSLLGDGDGKPTRVRPVASAPSGASSLGTTVDVAVTGVEGGSLVGHDPWSPPSNDAASGVAAGDVPATCKHAPIRGCAPSKDEFGCFHCTRCWRPYHYDMDLDAKTVSFSCIDMPEAPLYVVLTDKSAGGAARRWLVTASFDGRHIEQIVAVNLGAAFFSDFRGGDVKVTLALSECDAAAPGCRGDIDITVNAKKADAR